MFAPLRTSFTPYSNCPTYPGAPGINVERLATPVVSNRDWGLLGYWIGGQVHERIPVLDGIEVTPDLVRLKHFGAAAASSGGVEMYHIPGVTSEARTVDEAFGGRPPAASRCRDAAMARFED